MSKPPKNKSAAPPDAPVYHVDEDAQVDLLAQALLREYMHKKKFASTLAAFDEEHPRDENTVSSRAVMHDLMALAGTMPLLKERGIETVMEALCYLRVVKKDNVEEVRRLRAQVEAAAAEEAELTKRCEQLDAQVRSVLEARAAVPAPVKVKKVKTTSTAAEGGDDAVPKKPKKDKAGKKTKLLSIDELLEKQDVIPTSKPGSSVGAGSSQPSSTTPTPKHGQTSSPSNGGGGKDDDTADEDEDDYEAAIRQIRAEQAVKRSAAPVVSDGDKAGTGTRRTVWVEDTTTNASSLRSSNQNQPNPARDDVQSFEGESAPLPPFRAPGEGELRETAALDTFACLTGGKRLIPQSFQQQGWYPTQTRGGPSYGLEQRLGGPCGVLAVVQARVIQRMLNPASPTHGDFERSLIAALAATLAKIAVGSESGAAIIAQMPAEDAWPSNVLPNSVREQKQWMSLLRVTEVGVSSASAIEAALRNTGAAREWMKPGGSGLLCFLVSCVLTRGGNAACRSDMDAPQPLIVEHGYCSQEVTNLLLCGKATSNALDGTVDVGGMALRGYPGPLDVGFLTILEARGLMQAEKFAKYPTQCPAAWVVFNESHYTVLFVKDTSLVAKAAEARLSGLAPATDVYYYDQQGQQDSELRLTVTLPDDEASAPVPRVTARTSYVDVVIRTIAQWKKASISWNGADPLL